jgi:large subunit ribosomal protein L25
MNHMSDTLNVTLRQEKGTRESRRLRKAGMVPAILYGHGEACVDLAAKREDLEAAIRHGSRVVNLTGAVKTSALVRDLQWDTYGIKPMHVDFLRVSASDRVRVKLPVELKGECPGVRNGGVVNLVMHEIELDVPADHVEEHVVANVSHLEVGHTLRIKDLELPVGARAVHSVEETVVTCLVPGKKAAGDEAGAAAEPEVVGRKAGEEGAAGEGAQA